MSIRMRWVLAAMIGGFGALLGLVVLWALGPQRAAEADQACTITWSGSTSGGSWSTPGNWNLDRVPTTGDVVCITGVTGTVTYSTGTTLASELRSSAPLSLTGGELALTDTVATGNTVGGLSIAGGQLGDTSTDEGSLTDTGDFSDTSGNIYAPPAQSPTPSLTVDAAATATLASTSAGVDENWKLAYGIFI